MLRWTDSFCCNFYAVSSQKMRLPWAIILFGYPGYIVLVFAESVWLYCWLWSCRAPGRIVFIIVAAPIMLGALILIARMLWQRSKQVRAKPDGHEQNGACPGASSYPAFCT